MCVCVYIYTHTHMSYSVYKENFLKKTKLFFLEIFYINVNSILFGIDL